MSDLIYANGVDARTGEYLLEPVDPGELAAAIIAAPPSVPDADYLGKWERRREMEGLPWDVDPLDLTQAGWGVLFSTEEDVAVKSALSPLLEHRAAQVGETGLFHVLSHRPGETFLAWLGRHGPAPGTVDPTLVPYYVLVVGSPQRIPFEFQYLLDVEYAAGRLHFDDTAGYARYARSVVEYETAATLPHDHSTVFFGTKHAGDRATTLSADELVAPLARGEGGRPPEATRRGYRSTTLMGDEPGGAATRAALVEALEGGHPQIGRPALLFSATHGLGVGADDPHQRAVNGSLLCQDWSGGAPAPRDSVGAADVGAAQVHGLVAFLFACYSAGTPRLDEFPLTMTGTRTTIAPSPFVAALPQALLGHPDGGALAVVGHVERVWGYSIASLGERQLQPYQNALGQILAGRPVGLAMRDFNERYGVLSASLANLLREIAFGASVPSIDVATAWIERTDAQGFVVLGDPAVRLRPPATS